MSEPQPSYEELQEIVKTVPNGLYRIVLHQDGRSVVTYVNRALREMLGLTRELPIDMDSFLTSFSVIHPDDRESIRQASLASLTEAKDFEEEVRYLVKGVYRWIHIRSDAVKKEDGSVVFNGIITDVTQRRHYSDRLLQIGQILDKTFLPIYATSLDGTIVYANQAAQALYDISDWLTTPELKAFDLYTADTSEAVIESYMTLPRKISLQLPVQIKNKIGGEMPIYEWKFIVSGQELGDQIISTVAFPEGTPLDFQRQIEETSLHITELLGNYEGWLRALSHDLKEPLTAAKLGVELIRSDLPESQRELVNMVYECLEKAVDELKNFRTTIASGFATIRPVMAKLPLQTLFSKLDLLYASRCKGQQIDFRIVSTSLSVHTDAGYLEHILTNLISNAVRHSHADRILVGARHRKGQITIYVLDDGVGLPPNVHQQLHLEGADGLSGKSVTKGLGINIVRSYCQLLNVMLQTESDARGTRFMLSLPDVYADE